MLLNTSVKVLLNILLSHVCGCLGNEIHVLFDTYKPMSLKLNEMNLRGANDHPFVIAGPEQAPKQNCKKLLVNGIFKDQLAKFLQKEWQEDHYGAILAKKTLILSYGGKCVSVSYNNDEKKVTVEHPVILQGIHEESATLIAFHAAHMTGNVVVRASDTDVMVILVGMLGRRLIDVEQPTSLRIIMDCGSGNSPRYIDISDIVAALEVKQKGLASAMPGLHAFTGCDFTASFYRKGKIKPFEILEQDTKGTFINFFRKLTQREKPDQTAVEGFLCSLYGLKGMMDINEARHAKLFQMTGKVDEDYPMKNLKKDDCALLPPCSKTVQNKVQRAHFVSIVWGNAYSAHPESGLDPCDYGWKIKDGGYVPVWFMGPAEPNVQFEEEELASHEAENDHDNNAGNKNDNNTENDNDDNVEEYEDADNSGSEIEWSDDSESEDGS